MAQQEISTKDMETVDLALWRAGRREQGAVEAAFDSNYGLAARPPVLPARIAITMPVATSTRVLPGIKLWD